MMTTWTRGTAAMVLVAGLAAGCHKSNSAPAGAKAGGTPPSDGGAANSISDIMKRVNAGKGSLHREVGDLLQADPVDWATVEPKAKEYATLADVLAKFDPPKGDKGSWESMAKTYADNAKALHAAAEKKDKAAAVSTHEMLQGSCMDCHRAHRVMRGKGKG
jgi:cytochrome c556